MRLPAACLGGGSSVTVLRSCQEPPQHTAASQVHRCACLRSAQGYFCPGFTGHGVKGPDTAAEEAAERSRCLPAQRGAPGCIPSSPAQLDLLCVKSKKAAESPAQMAASSRSRFTSGGCGCNINGEGANNATCCIPWKHQAMSPAWRLNDPAAQT